MSIANSNNKFINIEVEVEVEVEVVNSLRCHKAKRSCSYL
jgi:hypothetical protein